MSKYDIVYYINITLAIIAIFIAGISLGMNVHRLKNDTNKDIAEMSIAITDKAVER